MKCDLQLDELPPPAPVIAALRQARRALLACHEDPDPDCVGSMLALARGLARRGVRVTTVCPDPLSTALLQLPGAESVRAPAGLGEEGPWDTGIVVDCEPARTRDAWPYLASAPVVINIDHHETNDGQVGLVWVEPEAAATGELVFAVLSALPVELDPAMACHLFAALQGDTGSFQFDNTKARTLRLAAHLVELGASPGEISQALYETRELGYVQLTGEVIRTLRRSPDGRIAWVHLTREMVERAGLRDSEVEGFVRYPRMIRGVEVALLFRETGDGRVRVSLRSRGRVDVSQLATRLGGGGHMRASGCTLAATLPEAEARVIALVSEALRDGSLPRGEEHAPDLGLSQSDQAIRADLS